MNAIKRILQYFSRRKEIHRVKKKVLDEQIDFDNIVSSVFHAKELYDELKTVCHPDRYHDSETIAKMIIRKDTPKVKRRQIHRGTSPSFG